MPPTFHIVRHAQGWHQKDRKNWAIRDPSITPKGDLQCRELRKSFPHMDKITHLVASPMRRTIQTCLTCFFPATLEGKKVILVPELQEVGCAPSTTGSSPEALEKEFGDSIDLSLVQDGWDDKSPDSPFHDSNPTKLVARVQKARQFLIDLSLSADDDAHIVVVTHGTLIDLLTRNFKAVFNGKCWTNVEYRSFQFVRQEYDRLLYSGRPSDEDVLKEVMFKIANVKNINEILRRRFEGIPRQQMMLYPGDNNKQSEEDSTYETVMVETDESLKLRI